MITVGVRFKDGVRSCFDVGPEDAANHEEAIVVARDNFPDALVILALVGKS